MDVLLYVYIAFSFIVFVFLLALDTRSAFRKTAFNKVRHGYMPNVLVIIPCRGVDLTLEKDLKSIKLQKYRKFKAIAVVDGHEDKSIPAIKGAGLDYMVSGGPRGKSSGKVAAILAAVRRFNNYNVYVIADSDIEVDESWLANLMAPMRDGRVGISTMFPYFNPLGGFWSKVKMAWGFVGESLLEEESSRFGWGGALAFRRSLVDKWFINLATRTEYGISDDICLTMAAKRKRFRIAYTKNSQPKVNSDDNFGKFIEWANRQTALTLLGYRKNLYLGVVYYSAEIVLFVSAIVLSIFISPLFLVYLLHLIRSYWKTYARSGKAYLELLLIVPMMPFMYLSNLLIANGMSSISWRGRKYNIVAHSQTGRKPVNTSGAAHPSKA